MQRTARLYLLIVGIAVFGILFILRAGSHLPAPGFPVNAPAASQLNRHDRAECSRLARRVGRGAFAAKRGGSTEPIFPPALCRDHSFVRSRLDFHPLGATGRGRGNDGRSSAWTIAFWVARAQCVSVCLRRFIARCLAPPEPDGCLPFHVCRRHGNGLGRPAAKSLHGHPCQPRQHCHSRASRRRACLPVLRAVGPTRRVFCRLRPLRCCLDEHHRFSRPRSYFAGPRDSPDFVRPNCHRLRRDWRRDGVGVARASRRFRQVDGFCCRRAFASVSC